MRYCSTRALEFMILEVGNFHGVKVGGSRRVVAWVINAASLLEMICYKLAWWLFIYQRVLCVNFVASVSFFSKWEDIVLLLSHAPQKKLKKNCICLLFDMLSQCSRRYNFEGLSCIYRRRVIRGARWARGKFKGTRRLIVDFRGKPESPC